MKTPVGNGQGGGGSTSEGWVVCTCNACSGRIEFEASNEGTTIECPHCKVETVLFVPEAQAELPEPEVAEPEEVAKAGPEPPKPEPKRAKLVEQSTYTDTGTEGRVEIKASPNRVSPYDAEEQLLSAGAFFLGIGVLVAVVACVAAFVNIANADTNATAAGIWFAVAVLAVLQGVVVRLLFKVAAQIILLLDAATKVTLAGKITQLSVRRGYKCSLCNAQAEPTQANCSRCGAEFVR